MRIIATHAFGGPLGRRFCSHQVCRLLTVLEIYLRADLAIKQKALDRTTPPSVKPGRSHIRSLSFDDGNPLVSVKVLGTPWHAPPGAEREVYRLALNGAPAVLVG